MPVPSNLYVCGVYIHGYAVSSIHSSYPRLLKYSPMANASTTTDSNTNVVAIVTGASQGIGYSIAIRLAQDGIDIAVNDIASKAAQIENVVNEIRKIGRKSIALPGDVTKEEEVKGIIETTVNELGGLDIVCRVLF